MVKIMNKHYPLKYILIPLFFVFCCAVFTSCNSEGDKNREDMKLLRKDMTKDEVLKIMGEPLVNEVYNKPNIWYYYVESQWSDGNRTSDECDPLVFENDKLIGWGKEFYKKYRQKNWKWTPDSIKSEKKKTKKEDRE